MRGAGRGVHVHALQVGDAGDGNGTGDALVGGRNPPRISPAPGPAGDADSFGIHLRSRLQVIDCPHRVPALHPRGRVAEALPPPLAQVVGAVVEPLDLPELQGVNHQAHITMLGQPGRMLLVVDLAAETHALLHHVAVPADIQHARGVFGRRLGDVQVAADIQPRPGLEVQFLHRELRRLDPAGDDRLQIGSRRQRPQSEHIEQLSLQFGPGGLPFLPGFEARQIGLFNVPDLPFEVRARGRFSGEGWCGFGRRVFLGLVRGQREEGSDQDDQQCQSHERTPGEWNGRRSVCCTTTRQTGRAKTAAIRFARTPFVKGTCSASEAVHES